MISFIQFFLENAMPISINTLSPKEMGLRSSMAYLPDHPPYGFWMDKSGNYMATKDHQRSGEEIIEAANKLLPRGSKINVGLQVYDFLLRAGWVRIVMAPYKIVLWETFPGNFPTQSQKSAMKFLQEFYEFKGVEMG